MIPTTPTEQVDRLLIGAPATLSFSPADEDGLAFDLDAVPVPTASVADGAGAEVWSGNATLSGDTHALTITVPADSLPLLDTYLVTWSASVAGEARSWTTQLEVCGGHLFTVAAFRAQRSEFASYTAERIRYARRLAEQRCEGETQVAFVPRGVRERIKCNGRELLVLGHCALRDVYSLSLDGVELTSDELAALDPKESGMIERGDDVWDRDAIALVHYEHGYDGPTLDVVEAVMTLARGYAPITSTSMPSRAVTQSIDGNVYRLSIAGRDGATGIPDVDAVLARWTRDLPAVG